MVWARSASIVFQRWLRKFYFQHLIFLIFLRFGAGFCKFSNFESGSYFELRIFKNDSRHPRMTPRMLLDWYWDLLKNIIFFTYDSKISLIMKGNGHCFWLSKINHMELSCCESELKYHKLILKNYPSSFECSKYHKLMKFEPPNHQKFTSHEN